MDSLDTDFLVVGSGIAGIMAALHLSRLGRVVIATKQTADTSNTNWAQGGVSCVMKSPPDSFDAHVSDTMDSGAGLCHEDVVRTVVAEGPGRIAEVVELGVAFARENGEYELGKEGGHSHRRVLHAGDITGHEMVKALLQQVRENPNITLMENLMAIDLVTTGWIGEAGPSRCIGAYFFERETETIMAIRARHTVLATGGAGKVYLYTTNPDVATGDGIAMAWRAGLPIRNMEFIQFHPTCLFHTEARSFLISEAVRGEGAELINERGEAFMSRYHEQGSLAVRDIVARAIDHEMKVRGDQCVYLDITKKSRDQLHHRFPNIYDKCLSLGIDMAEQPVPVVPAAHYCCGGMVTGIDGKTDLPGLHGIGEVTCTGLHGANRLASNSLLEGMVAARKLADRLTAEFDPAVKERVAIPDWDFRHAEESDELVVVEHNWNEVRTCMWDYVGIVRTDKRLERALRRIRMLRNEIREYYLQYLVTSDTLELRNIAAVAELIIRSARMRKESRGLHYTLDYPELGERTGDSIIHDPPGEHLV